MSLVGQGPPLEPELVQSQKAEGFPFQELSLAMQGS